MHKFSYISGFAGILVCYLPYAILGYSPQNDYKEISILKISIRLIIGVVLLSLVYTSCASKKRKKKEPSAFGKFYHNTTAQYNGYFNANEIIKESYLKLEAAHQDDYTEILPLYDYVNINDPKMVDGELDRAIEKVTTVALIHKPSHWVDDCYVLMGHAQYLKQDFESSEETFTYFKEEFDPSNPFGRNYKKKKVSKKALKKEREKERKEAKKLKAKEKKEKEKEREQKKKDKEAEKKQQQKDRDAARKQREKDKKQRAKSKKRSKKKKKTRGKKRRPAKKTETKPVENTESASSPKKTQEPAKAEEPTTPTATPTVPEDDPRAIDEDELNDSTDKKEKEKKKKKDKTAYSKGQMWLARTYVQRDKYSSAKYLVRKMQNDGGLPDDVARELPVIMADVYIKEKRYEDALPYLDEAIELANKKKNKARYAYVAGQLSEEISQRSAATDYYANAKKWSSDFRMEFMAELSAEKNNLGSGRSSEAVLAKLNKMTSERKYAEYLDQLYYTMAEIELDNDDFAAALSSYRKSISNNNNNVPLKVETYYKLANLFYDKEDYVEAKYHYDSTLQVIDKGDRRYRETKTYSENLTDIARNINTIELQDSLLALSKLDDTEIRAMAEEMVEKGLKAEKASGPATKRESGLLTSNRGVFGKSKYWAYDQQVRDRHAKDFEDKWGDITLQDDWRRSDKQNIYANDEEVAEADSLNSEERKLATVNAMMTDIKKQLPYSPQQKAEVFKVLSSALFQLGKLYRDKLSNFDKAIETHESLLSRFPSTDKKLDTYYYLYLSNLEKPDGPRAEYYKGKIVSEYPDTEYAKVISDPAYAQSLLNEGKQLEAYYQETYALFEAGDYQKAYNQSKAADQKFGKDNELRPKFSLLNAMALGSIKGKEVYVKALREVIAKYPNTPEKARAEEIMRFLQGDASAFDVTDMKEVDDIFSVEDNLKHYIAVVLYDIAGDDLERAKIAVSEYNKKNFADDRLQLSDSNLNREEKKEIILVRKFKNKEEAMAYYDVIIKAGSDFISTELAGYSIYAITQRNYRKLVIERDDNRYRVFFDKYYLGRE